MADTEFNVGQNIELKKIGELTKVKGYAMRGASINNTYNVLGMVNAIKASDGTQKQIVVVDGAAHSDAYTFDPINSAWTKNNLSLTTGSRAEFESFLNGFFMVNFNDATRFNNLSAWSTVTNVTSAARAKFVKLYLGRLYLGYVVSNGGTFPSKVTYSELPNTSTSPGTITWNDTLNFFDVDSDNGDFITGLEVNASRLMVFKQNSLYLYDTNTLQQLPGCPGTVANRSIQNIQGHTLYLHPSGIWDFAGSGSSLISRKIQELIDGISSKYIELANGYVSGDHYYLFVGDVANFDTGFAVSKCLIDYNIAFQSFTWRSLEDNPLDWMLYPDITTNITYNQANITYNDANTFYNGESGSAPKVFFGSDAGSAFQFNTGGQQNGKDISMVVETKDYWLQYPAFWKLIQKVIIFNTYAGNGRLVIQAKLDEKDWITLVSSKDDPLEYIFPKGSICRRVRFRISESSSGKPFSFEGLDIYFTATGLVKGG